MKKLIPFLAIVILIPFAGALSCEDLKSQRACKFLENSDLSEQEKTSLIARSLAISQNKSLEEFVKDWNRKIEVGERPFLVIPSSSEWIKNGWVEIVNVEPSVYKGEKLLVPKDGKIRTVYGYEIRKPSGSEECGLEIVDSSIDEELWVYLNGEKIGKGQKVRYSLDELGREVDFSTLLRIEVEFSVQYYEEENGSCVPSYEDTFEDSLGVVDYLTAYNPKFPEPLFKINGKKAIAWIPSDGYRKIEADFGNSKYVWDRNYWQVRSEHEPYEFLTLVSKESSSYGGYGYEIVGERNISEGKRELISFPEEPGKCELKVYGYFENKTLDCGSLKPAKLNLSLSKYRYDPDEKVEVKVTLTSGGKPLPEERIRVEYGEEEKVLLTDSEGTAETEFNVSSETVVEAFYPGSSKYSWIEATESFLIIPKELFPLLGFFLSSSIALILVFWGFDLIGRWFG